jgi:hypothetical protein
MATPNSAGTPAITSNSSSSKRSKDANEFHLKEVLYPYKSPLTKPPPRWDSALSEFNSNVSVSNIRACFEVESVRIKKYDTVRREQKQFIIPDLNVSVKNKRAAFEVETLVKREIFAKSSSNLIIGDNVPPERTISSVDNSTADNAGSGLISKNSTEVTEAEPVSSDSERKQGIIPDLDGSVKTERAAFEVETLVKREIFTEFSSNFIIGDYMPHERTISSVNNSTADNAGGGLISKKSSEFNTSEPESIANISSTNPILDYQIHNVSSDSELPSHDLTIKEERHRLIFNENGEYIKDPLDICKLKYLFFRHRKFNPSTPETLC